MIRNTRRKVRRNEPCPFCRSGRKFKLCCGRAVGAVPASANVTEAPHKDWFIGLRNPSARNARRKANRTFRRVMANPVQFNAGTVR